MKQYAEDATSAEQGIELVEMDARSTPSGSTPSRRPSTCSSTRTSARCPSSPKVRVIYHPPEAKPIVGFAKGLNAPGANRVEIFKDGKLTNPVKKKKRDYETY